MSLANQPLARMAARLVYKGLHTTLSPVNDPVYRELLDMARADTQFFMMVQDVADGLELVVLDFSERGLILAPTSRESKFSVRLSDIRAGLKAEQKAGLLLAHVAVASVFYPTTDGLDDDNYVPPPASVAQFRDALQGLALRLKDGGEDVQDLPLELAPGWELICALPSAVPGSQRAGITSVTGLVTLALSHMSAGGLARLDRETSDEDSNTYTATHRLRIQLRELSLRRLFELAQTGNTTPHKA
jgi:hypothetical protein